jgi:hypothetical protein
MRNMEKKDILELFLKNGILLSPEEFEATDEKNYMQLLERRSGEKKDSEVAVFRPKTGKISCEQFIKICSSKFEFLKDEILKKTEAVSINKGKRVFSEATIIGRVKEMTSNGFILEDITGETEVVSEGKDIHISDILGLKGFFRENKFFPNQVIWPDIPLDNSPERSGAGVTLTTKVKEDMSGVIVCPDSEKTANVITGFGRFGVIKVSKQHVKSVIIAYSPPNEVSEDAAVKILKKRVIPEKDIVENMITEIPGILWLFNNGRNWTKNYRGVLVISSDSGSFAEYDGGEVVFGKIG